MCPYHAWTYDLRGSLKGAPGFRELDTFQPAEHGLVELPVVAWAGWVLGHALEPLGSPRVPPFERHLGELARLLAPYDAGSLVVADRHTYEVAANWKVIARELPRVLPLPADPPGAVRGDAAGLGRELRPARRLDRRRHGAARRHGVHVAGRHAGRDTAARRRPEHRRVPAPAAQPAGLRAPRLRDDPPDGAAGAGPDLGRVQLADAARVRGVGGAGRRGVLGHHQPPGLGRLRVGAARARRARTSGRVRSRRREDAVAQLVETIGSAYRSGGLTT